MLLNHFDLEQMARQRQRALLAEAEAARRVARPRAAAPLDRLPRLPRPVAAAPRKPTGAA